MEVTDKIFVAGHRGMVGSAIVRYLQAKGFQSIVTRTRAELDLTDALAVKNFFDTTRPDIVILAAAKVGGIMANMQAPAQFLYENVVVQSNVIHSSWQAGVKKFCFLGSSCIYPRECPQPMKEEYLLTGPLEPTNEGYALAKITGLKMVESFHKQYGFKGISLMPCNLYGPNDSFDPQKSHVLSALVRKFVEATRTKDPFVTNWGTGVARREFMHVEDLARAVCTLMDTYDSPAILNIGTGTDVTIKELAETVAAETGYRGEIRWDTSKPDGMPRKCLDVSRLTALGFQPRISLREGIREMIASYKSGATQH